MKKNAGLITAILGVSANCPGNAKVNTNVALTGDHSYSITNASEDDITVNIIRELKDSDNHIFTASDPIDISAGQTANGNDNTLLNASYSTTGPKTVTATTRLEGVITQSKNGTCSFQVSQ